METSVSAILSQELTSIICEHMPLSSKGCGKVTTHRRATLKEKHLIIQPWSTIVFEKGLEKHYLCNFFSLALFYLAKMYILHRILHTIKNTYFRLFTFQAVQECSSMLHILASTSA